jgi:hypothetical protein
MATFSAQLSVTTGTPLLLWQTSTGVSPDPKTTLAGNATAQIFRAGTFNDPVPILIENQDETNSVFLGPVGVSTSTGLELEADASLTYNAVGNDSVYAIATGGTVVVGITVGRQ